MRKIMLAAAIVLACGAAHAQGLTSFQVAQATTAPATQAAPAAPTPQAAAPDTTQLTAQPAKPSKKRQAKRRGTDEAKARRIAAKYGVSW
jgi:hypothetical protein